MESNNGSGRPWRDIAAELAAEKHPQRIIELTEELNQALEAQMGLGSAGADPSFKIKTTRSSF